MAVEIQDLVPVCECVQSSAIVHYFLLKFGIKRGHILDYSDSEPPEESRKQVESALLPLAQNTETSY